MKRYGFFLLLLVISVYCTAPFVWQFITSIKPYKSLTTLPPLLPESPVLIHYISVFSKSDFLKIITNSFIVASSATFLSLLIGSLTAFALAWLRVKRKVLIMAFILSVSMFPPIATVSPLFLIIKAMNMRDTLMALIITYTTFTLPLSIWVLTNFFQGISKEIYLSSRVDGCSHLQSFYRIILPLSAPGIFATAILVFIFSWNEFLYALTFTSTDKSRTIPVGIALFPGLHEVPWGELAAASVIVTVPLVIIVFLFQGRIVEGLTTGAVKG